MKKDRRGVVYVETLIAFLPVLTFFFGTLHVADVSVAHLVVDHAATVAARAAVVVLPDDGAYYNDPGNDLLHLFEGKRRDHVEAAADYVMGANPRLDSATANVALDRAEYTYRDPLTAQVTARYTCLITTFCGDGFDITGKADLVYQGADYIYASHGAGIDNLVASLPSRHDRPDRPDDPPYPDADPDPTPSTRPTGRDNGADDDRTTPRPDNDRRPTGQDGEGDNTNRGPPEHGQPGNSSDDTPSGPDGTSSDTLPDDAIAAASPGTKPGQDPETPACTGTGCRRQPDEEGGCFVAGTLISTPEGAKPIETIAAGDEVYAYDVTRGDVVVRTVPQTTVRQSDRVIDLQIRYLNGGRKGVISGTPEHPFYVPARGEYVPLGALPQHAVLRTVGHGEAVVESARVRYGDFDVFNFEVESEHNYFVAALASEQPGVLVHNQTRDNCGPGAARQVPGTPGRVTGGSSTRLGRNLMEEMGLPRDTRRGQYQAQHILPSELRDHPVIRRLGVDFDDASNGIFLPVPDDSTVSTLSRHRGYHSVYNEVVERQLDRLDPNAPIADLDREVADLQRRLRILTRSGTPLYPSQGATIEMWERLLAKVK